MTRTLLGVLLRSRPIETATVELISYPDNEHRRSHQAVALWTVSVKEQSESIVCSHAGDENPGRRGGQMASCAS